MNNEQNVQPLDSSGNAAKPIVSSSALPPAPCRVRITQCSYEQGWYRNLIGEEFDVDNAGGVKDYVLWEDYAGQRTMWRHIAKQDCVLVRHCC